MENNERWRQIDRIFTAALEMTGSEREAFLHKECGGDPQLLAAVTELIDADNETCCFLDQTMLPEALRVLISEETSQAASVQVRSLSPLQPGDLIDSFKIIRQIGRGGMGDVFLARDMKLGRKVALKLVRRDGIATHRAPDRFLVEARTTARFSHPNIVVVHAVGEHEGLPYLALEFVEGRSLRDRLDEGPVSAREAVRYGLAIAEALKEAHRHGVLHRDLKPENIVIPKDGGLKVVDFGLARTLSDELASGGDSEVRRDGDREQKHASVTSAAVGTPRYMAPQLWQGRPPSPATDVWALGMILLELVNGEHPWQHSSVEEIHAWACRPDPPSLQVRPVQEPGLERLIRCCLDREGANRPTAERLVEELGELLDGAGQVGTLREQSPFRGLLPFGEQNARWFFGRDSETEAAVERLRVQPILVVAGASGAGKSSFVQAGVIPRLREQGSWVVLRLRPGRNPFRSLAKQLLTASGLDSSAALDQLTPQNRVVVTPRKSPSKQTPGEAENALQELVDNITASPAWLALTLGRIAELRQSRVLLFVDQLEEVFTLTRDEPARTVFLSALMSCADDCHGPVRAVCCIREDFLGRLAACAKSQQISEWLTILGLPRPESLRRAMEEPVRASGYSWDDGLLVDEMLGSVQGNPAALALLQFTGEALWKRRDGASRSLKRSAYEEIGGVAGALARHAEEVFSAIPPEQARCAREIFLRLVTPEGARRVMGRSALLEGLPRSAGQVVDRFVAARTLLIRRSGREDRDQEEVELVHEALVQVWPRLARWLRENKEGLVILAEARQAAELWARRGRRREELWQGQALKEAHRHLEHQETPVPALVWEFLAAARQREHRLSRRRRRLLIATIAVPTLVAVGLAALTMEAFRQKSEAQAQRAEALLESASAAMLREQPIEARARLRAALEASGNDLAAQLWFRLQQRPLHMKKYLHAQATACAFSPDQRALAVAADDGSIRLLDTDTGVAQPIIEHEPPLTWLRFAPDGLSLVGGPAERGVYEIDLARGEIHTVGEHGATMPRLSVDGRRAAMVLPGHRIGLVDMGTGNEVILDGQEAAISSFEIDQGGAVVATLDQDNVVRLWDALSGRLIAVRPAASPIATQLRVGRGGQTVALADDSGGVHLWRPAAGPGLVALQRPEVQEVAALSLNLGGSLVAVVDTEGTAWLWSTIRPDQATVVGYFCDTSITPIFQPGGPFLAMATIDGKVRLFNVATRRLVELAADEQDQLSTIIFSPDGRYLVATGADRFLRLWDMRRVRKLGFDRGHSAAVGGLAFSADGRTVASCGEEGLVLLWDLSTGNPITQIDHLGAPMRAVEFIDGGHSLLSGGSDRCMRRWSLPWLAAERINCEAHTTTRFLKSSSSGGLLAACTLSGLLLFSDGFSDIGPIGLGTGGSLLACAASPDDRRLVVTGYHGELFEVDARTGGKLQSAPNAADAISGVVYGPGGQEILASVYSSRPAVFRWDLVQNELHRLLPLPSRPMELAISPDGSKLAIPLENGEVKVVRSEGTAVLSLLGHHGPALSSRFGPRGKVLASGGEDGTVRLWDVESGRPIWNTFAVLSSPAALFTQEGWVSLEESGGQLALPEAGWRRSVEESGRLATQSRDGSLLCLARFGGSVELWDLKTDEKLAQVDNVSAERLLATERSCVVLEQSSRALAFDHHGRVREIRPQVDAISSYGDTVLVAGSNLITCHRASTGQEIWRQEASGKVTALARVGDSLVLGYEDGSLGLVSARGSASVPSLLFEESSVARVEIIIEAPDNTILAGHRNGELGIWSLATGARLSRTMFHGRVIHALRKGDRIHVATDLGDHETLVLDSLSQTRCELLREVWREVPVAWEAGKPVRALPPTGHPCQQ